MAVQKLTQLFSFIYNLAQNRKWMMFMLLILQQVKCPPTKHETLDLLKICDASPKKLPQACEVESFQESSCSHVKVYHCLLSNSSKQNYPFIEKCLDPMIVDRGKCAVLSEKEMKIIQCKGPDCPTEKYLSLCAFKYEGCKQADIFNRSNDATANSNEKVPLTTPIKEQESILSSVQEVKSIAQDLSRKESIHWSLLWAVIVIIFVAVLIYCCRGQIKKKLPECWRRLCSSHLSQGHTEDGRRNQKLQPDSDPGTSINLTDISPPSDFKNEGYSEEAKDDQEESEERQSFLQPDPGSSSAGESKTWENLPSSSQQHRQKGKVTQPRK